jgi:hypothetical protein
MISGPFSIYHFNKIYLKKFNFWGMPFLQWAERGKGTKDFVNKLIHASMPNIITLLHLVICLLLH